MALPSICPQVTRFDLPRIILLSFIFFGTLTASGQENHPTVTFSIDFPGSDPSHYEISLSDDGTGSYDSNGKLMPGADITEIAKLNFRLSWPRSARVFELAKQAHYFSEKTDVRKKNIAFTGNKVLSYKDPGKTASVTYNYSASPPIQDLTAIFQGLSVSLEFGRRLEYEAQHQKLALSDELKKLETMTREGNLSDISVISPILETIAQDQSLLNVDRGRALRLAAAATSSR
jgi:hypothetical protein